MREGAKSQSSVQEPEHACIVQLYSPIHCIWQNNPTVPQMASAGGAMLTLGEHSRVPTPFTLCCITVWRLKGTPEKIPWERAQGDITEHQSFGNRFKSPGIEPPTLDKEMCHIHSHTCIAYEYGYVSVVRITAVHCAELGRANSSSCCGRSQMLFFACRTMQGLIRPATEHRLNSPAFHT